MLGANPADATAAYDQRRTGPALRVLSLVSSLERRGAQTFAVSLTAALGRAGHEARLVSLSPGEDGAGAGDLPDWGRLTRGAYPLEAIVSTAREFRRYRPHVVLAHGGESYRCALLARGPAARPALVYRKIGLTVQWLRRPRRLRLLWHRALVGRADMIAAVGSAVAAETVDLLRVPAARVRILRRGMDPRPFAAATGARERVRAALGIPSGTAAFLSLGVLGWEKHQETMLRTLASLRADGPPARLLLAGEGPERARLEHLAAALGLGEAVGFLGTRKDVPELLAASDALLLTSLTEGLPGVLVEAGMAGVPVVAWDVAGVREVVQDGITGLVPPYRDEGAFLVAVRRLLADQEASRRMGVAAREFCRERFAMDRCVEEHLQLFRDLLGGRG